MLDQDLRRALRFIVPYWRRLLLVLALSGVSTALSLYLPLLSRDFVDGALIGRNTATLARVAIFFTAASLAAFAVNVASGLRYTRVSADILFDMRLEMYRHLQRLSPRFYARTRTGDIMSRINNDIGEIQRIAAETVLAWAGNLLFLAGTIVMLAWLDIRLFALTVVTAPLGMWALVHYRTRLGRCQSPYENRPRRRRQRPGARGGAIQGAQRPVRPGTDVDAARLLSGRRAARTDCECRDRRSVRVRGTARDPRRDDGGDILRVHGVPDAVPSAAAGVDGDIHQPRNGARLAAADRGNPRSAGRGAGAVRGGPPRSRSR